MATASHPDPSVGALQEEVRRLRRAVEELSILNDLARAIGASLNSEQIMHTIIHRSLRAVGAEQGVITLVDEEASDSMKTLVRTAVSSAGHSKYHFNQALLGWMHINKKPLTINSPGTDERFRGVRWDDSIRSLLCVPMLTKSSLRGVLTVYNKKDGGPFTDEDQRLLAIIAGQSGQVVENARLNELEQSLISMKEELRLAATIQSGLLPREPPSLPGLDVAGTSVPAQVVGGDYFDFIPMDEHHVALCLGDVSGKGVPASLLMANLQATLRGQTHSGVSARDCVSRSNGFLHRSTSPDKFVTLFYGILDTHAKTLTYSNAGHEAPFLSRADGEFLRLQKGGLILSILEDFVYEEETLALQPGDVLVIYSDGFSEAMNPDGQQFGDEKIREVIAAHRNRPAAGIIDALVKAVRAHADTAPQADDMTLIVVRTKDS
jgi:sigma-B regulation protein RsbU (phosphoserine phosphatase)